MSGAEGHFDNASQGHSASRQSQLERTQAKLAARDASARKYKARCF